MNIKFSSNVCLNPSENERYQLVYDTQLYHSFFGVYAQFKTRMDTNDQVLIDEINFMGITYKGLINFDFHNASIGTSSTSKMLYIDIEIRAAKDLQPKTRKYNLKLDGRNIKVENEAYLEVNRELLPMNNNPQNDIEGAFVNGVFDDEFYVRDGLYIKEREEVEFVRPNYIGDRIPGDADPIEIDKSIKNSEAIMSPGIRCIPGISKIWI